MLIIDYGLKNYATIVHRYNNFLYYFIGIVYCVTCTVYSVTYSTIYWIT